MHESKTHFEQIPVETVEKIATRLPAKEFPGAEEAGDRAGNVETEDKEDKELSPQERWQEVAERVQREDDPKKMIRLVQRLITTFDDEQLRKRPLGTRACRSQSGTRQDQS